MKKIDFIATKCDNIREFLSLYIDYWYTYIKN